MKGTVIDFMAAAQKRGRVLHGAECECRDCSDRRFDDAMEASKAALDRVRQRVEASNAPVDPLDRARGACDALRRLL